MRPKIAEREILEKVEIFGRVSEVNARTGGNADCLVYPRTLVFYMPAKLWYSGHSSRQHGEVFDAISYETGRNCYINFIGRGAEGVASIVRSERSEDRAMDLNLLSLCLIVVFPL